MEKYVCGMSIHGFAVYGFAVYGFAVYGFAVRRRRARHPGWAISTSALDARRPHESSVAQFQ
jgi:hypothetical protein